MRKDTIQLEETRLQGINDIKDYPSFHERHRIFPAVFENREHKRILDIAAGVGIVGNRIQDHYKAELVCNDTSPTCLKTMRKLGITTTSFDIDDEKKDFLRKALFVVMPSRYEGWGIAAIEASACSRAVIGADIPGLRDAVIDGKTGVLVKPENSDSLAEAMDRLLDNKEERERFGINGREYAGKFDWDVITNEHEQFYLEVLENNKL